VLRGGKKTLQMLVDEEKAEKPRISGCRDHKPGHADQNKGSDALEPSDMQNFTRAMLRDNPEKRDQAAEQQRHRAFDQSRQGQQSRRGQHE
jgi:hypothetical protein